jgi:hypothetical protein
VISAFMKGGERNSVLGPYSIEADGETTLSVYGVDRVREGQPVFYRAIQTRGPET